MNSTTERNDTMSYSSVVLFWETKGIWHRVSSQCWHLLCSYYTTSTIPTATITSTSSPLSTGAAVGVTLAGPAVMITILGFLAGLLVMYLITRKKALYTQQLDKLVYQLVQFMRICLHYPEY